MLQNFTNYLMGSLLGVENSSSITLRPENQGQMLRPEDQGQTSSSEDQEDSDDEWVLLDAEKEAGAMQQCSLTRTSSESSLQSGSVMEESWYITPPPCFTSEGPILSTSPLENLLIEHPSMSVYHFNTGSVRYFTVSNPTRSDDEGEDEDEDEEEEVVVPVVENYAEVRGPLQLLLEAERNLLFFPDRDPVEVQQEKERYQTRQAQKLQMNTTRKQLRRNYLVRHNKAREVNSRNHRQRRGERSQGANRSRANNNRKC